MDARWIERIVVRELSLIKRELDAYPADGDLWKELPGVTNSAGTLVLHLCGNLQHFIGAEIGQTGYVRQRDLEFSRRGVSRADLQAELDRAIGAVSRTLGTGRRLDETTRMSVVGGKFTVDLGDWMIHLVSHLAYHMGQIDYHRRVVTGQATSLDPVAIGALASAEKTPG
jgi:uncharacterized damage-inducible protein DinB